MNIAQALKEKNRLAGQITALNTKLGANSRWLKGNKPTYELEKLLFERSELVDKLVELKTRISSATLPIVKTLYRLAEHKSTIKTYTYVDVRGGSERDYSGNVIEWETGMTQMEKDNRIAALEQAVNDLQDEIDNFNATTLI